MTDYEELFGFKTQKKKDRKTENVTDKLLEVPKKDNKTNMPHFERIGPNIAQQADLLFLPDDNGYKYALVVADIGGHRLCDAEPLKNKDQQSVLKAFKAIY